MTDKALNNSRVTPAQYLVLLVELGLVLGAAYIFNIERRYGFQLILPVIFLGFAIHAWMPLRLRPAFFLALSLISILIVMGVLAGGMLLLSGALLLALCYLPWTARIGALLAVGALLSSVRAGWLQFPGVETYSTKVLPLLAAMFMFRLILYVYEQPHERVSVPLARRLAYFFMLPNVCFPLFPVIDYRTYVREYYTEPAAEVYQKGLTWVMRGVIHLLLYRLVYYHLTPSFSEVTSLAGVVQYVVSSYMLYLRVSGMFHLVIGVLCLFGYNLPGTHRLYFLSSSFTDFWRRINIYWKDFVMKVLYYPLFMRLKKYGMTQAVMMASLITLVLSWMWHSYQTFWLQGTFPITIQDAVFWSGLGIAVAINSVIELKSGRARAAVGGRENRTVRTAFTLALKTVAMFCFMSVLWSFWSTSSVDEWFAVMRVASDASAGEALVLAGSLVGLVLLGTVVQVVANRGWVLSSERQASLGHAALGTVFLALVVAGLGTQRFGQQLSGTPQNIWASLTSGAWLNVRDQHLETRGYYEELLGAETEDVADRYLQGNSIANRYLSKVGIKGLADAVEGTNDLRRYQLRAGVELSYKGADFHTNSWGMRDQEYARAKPPGVCRILLFGDSYTMGSGVPDESTYESLIEERLNRERPVPACAGYEVLNFAIASYSPLQSAIHAGNMAPGFSPDVLIYATAQPDLDWTGWRLAAALTQGAKVNEPVVGELVRNAGIDTGMNQFEILRRLKPVQRDLVQWSYRTMVDTASGSGARPVWIMLPSLDSRPAEDNSRYAMLAPLAQEAGFASVQHADVLGDRDRNSLKIAPWDEHPNEQAHVLIADWLFKLLTDAGTEGCLLCRPVASPSQTLSDDSLAE